MKYSLADYILNVKSNDQDITTFFGGTDGLTIGGEGSAVDSISINMDANLYETSGFATGAWVHDKNLSRTGTASVNLSQLSKNVAKLKQLCNMYFGRDYNGLTLSLIDSNGAEIARCEDCFVQKIPSQEFGSKAAMQSWTFTCGKITIN